MSETEADPKSLRKFPRRRTRLMAYCSSPELGELKPVVIWSVGWVGAGLQLRHVEVALGDRLEVVLTLPHEALRLVLESEVVWVQPADEAAKAEGAAVCRFGVRFEEAPASDYKLLKEFVAEGQDDEHPEARGAPESST